MLEPGNNEYSDVLYGVKRDEERRFVCSMDDCVDINIRQSELTNAMRRTLIDWLTEVVEEYNLQTSTLFLAVHMIDRLLLSVAIKKNQFQLWGSGCLLIASKIEDVEPPSLNQLTYISDSIFDEEALVLMEQRIMILLSFDVYAPTRYYFCARFCGLFELSPLERELACYLLELSMHDMAFNSVVSSYVAAAAVHLSLQMCRFAGDRIWLPMMEVSTRIRERDLVPCVQRLRKLHCEIGEGMHQNTIKKYGSPKHLRVSELTPLAAQELRFDFGVVQVGLPTTPPGGAVVVVNGNGTHAGVGMR